MIDSGPRVFFIMEIDFTKMHGNGNDFIIIDEQRAIPPQMVT